MLPFSGTLSTDPETGADCYIIYYSDSSNGGASGNSQSPQVIASYQDGTVTVYGSDSDDHFEFNAATLQLTVNTVAYDLNAADFSTITFDAAGGDDTVVFRGSAADEVVKLSPGEGHVTGDGYELSVSGVEDIAAYSGGGNDVAWLFDSAGNDTYTATPTAATMTGAGYSLIANRFRIVHGLALRGGIDNAYLYDSPGNDIYRGDGAQGRMFYASGAFARARYFDNYFTYSLAGGHDVAILNGTARSDIFYGMPTVSRLYGRGYYHRVVQYDEVSAYGNGGDDSANLTDSSHDDYLTASGTTAQLSGREHPVLHSGRWFQVCYSRLQ